MEASRIWEKSMETKKDIRTRILKLRKDRDLQEWETATAQIAERVTSHPWFQKTSDVCIYMDIRKEVGTWQIIREAWRLGKRVWLPRTEGQRMEFFLTESKDRLTVGAYGIQEPSGDRMYQGDSGLMIMPGVAFDEERHRIGFGGGYYDRYLERHPELFTMAIAFEDQVLPKIPADEHDIRPMLLVTQDRIRGPY